MWISDTGYWVAVTSVGGLYLAVLITTIMGYLDD